MCVWTLHAICLPCCLTADISLTRISLKPLLIDADIFKGEKQDFDGCHLGILMNFFIRTKVHVGQVRFRNRIACQSGN